MSYCRFGEADIYLYKGMDGLIYCCGCPLDDGDDVFETPEKALAHIQKHRSAGHFVPLDVDERLEEEIKGGEE